MFENCMLVPAERCSGVCRYINMREKGGGEEDKGHYISRKLHSPRDFAAGQTKGEKITKSGPLHARTDP